MLPEAQAQLADATIAQWTWKTPAMKAMTLAVCRLALARGRGEFSANDLPEFDHGGGGVAGAIFNRLAKDGVIGPVCHPEGGALVQNTVRNAGGNRIGVWRLVCAARAQRALEVHGERVERFVQPELMAV